MLSRSKHLPQLFQTDMRSKIKQVLEVVVMNAENAVLEQKFSHAIELYEVYIKILEKNIEYQYLKSLEEFFVIIFHFDLHFFILN